MSWFLLILSINKPVQVLHHRTFSSSTKYKFYCLIFKYEKCFFIKTKKYYLWLNLLICCHFMCTMIIWSMQKLTILNNEFQIFNKTLMNYLFCWEMELFIYLSWNTVVICVLNKCQNFQPKLNTLNILILMIATTGCWSLETYKENLKWSNLTIGKR